MNDQQWFKTQLQNTLDMLNWALNSIPEDALSKQPPDVLSEWPIHRHIYHLYIYEKLALPFKRQWLGVSISTEESIIMRQIWNEQDRRWPKKSAAHWFSELEKLREETITLIPKFPQETWQEKHPTAWEEQTLHWLYTKTIQHTYHHINTIMHVSLFWDDIP